MRNFRLFLAALLPLLLTLSGCGGAGTQPAATGPTGTAIFNIDLQKLVANVTAKSVTAVAAETQVFTAVTVELTRDGYQTVTKDLTVSGNIATGRVDNLAIGYWRVHLHVFNGTSEVYQGTQDVNIVAGAVTPVNILIDPVVAAPTDGSVTISVGVNPLPGYTAITKQVSKVLFDEAAARFYLFDASASTITVYDADTMTAIKDVPLAVAPLSIVFSAAKDAFFLGYPSGQIYRLDIASGTQTLAGDVQMEITGMIAVSDQLLLTQGKASYPNVNFKVLNLSSGAVVGTKSYYYYFGDMLLNPVNGIIYAKDVGVSPVDIFRINVDRTSGAITEIVDSPYHGDYSLNDPLRIIKNGTRVVAGSGTTFSSSTVASQDMLYSGGLGYQFNDLAVDNALNQLYLVQGSSSSSYPYVAAPSKLIVLDQDTYFPVLSSDLPAIPKYVFSTAAEIIVFVVKDNVYYNKVFSKAALGLL